MSEMLKHPRTVLYLIFLAMMIAILLMMLLDYFRQKNYENID